MRHSRADIRAPAAQAEAGDGGAKKGQLITTEDQEIGQIGRRVYWMYMKVSTVRGSVNCTCHCSLVA